MDFDLQKLLRPHIAALKPYASARDEYSGKAGVFLDANENPWVLLPDRISTGTRIPIKPF